MESKTPQEFSFNISPLTGGAFSSYGAYQKVLSFLSDQQEKFAAEDLIVQKTELTKETVIFIIDALINNGFVSHSIRDRQHWYRLLAIEWEIKITFSPARTIEVL